jgi:hypothetical protein
VVSSLRRTDPSRFVKFVKKMGRKRSGKKNFRSITVVLTFTAYVNNSSPNPFTHIGRRTEKRDKEIEEMRSACIKLRQEVKLAEEMAAEAQAAAGVGPGAAAEASEERRAAKRKSLMQLQAMNSHVATSAES